MSKDKEATRRAQLFCARCEWELSPEDCDWDPANPDDLICGCCVEADAERDRAAAEQAAAMGG